MKLKLSCALIFFFISSLSYAEITGELTDTGGVGSYTISIENSDDGHVYNGTATDIGNHQLKIIVSDGIETYQGIATADETGNYRFDLPDKNSGKSLVGTIDTEGEEPY